MLLFILCLNWISFNLNGCHFMYVMFGPGAIPYGFDLYELYPGRSYPLGQSSPGQSVLILSVLLYWAFNLQMLISMPPFFFS